MTQDFDYRITPAKGDLAAAFLQGQLKAQRFVTGLSYQIQTPVADLLKAPQTDLSLQTQLLFGEEFTVYEQKDGWAWGQACQDGYVGYVRDTDLLPKVQQPNLRVSYLRTPLYSQPDIKSPISGFLHLNSLIYSSHTEQNFRKTSLGWVFCDHLKPVTKRAKDWVAVAQTYLQTPYVWGGRSSFGLDCSALVQNALIAAGISCPRDSDMQEEALGEPIPILEVQDNLRRGDLIFWPGHVGIMIDPHQIIHANGHHMATVIEPLTATIGRTHQTAKPIRSIRRFT